ncbi:MAG: YveK family protein [Eubacterium sp.]
MNNNNYKDKDDEITIDLKEIAYVLMEKLHYIVMFLLVGAVVFNMYSYFLIKPTYTSTSRLYVVSATKDSVVNFSDLSVGTNLTKDYVELLLSYPVLDKVSEKIEKDYDYKISSESLQKMISLENPEDTRILNINVTTTDPKVSKTIANALADEAVEYIPDTMGTFKPNIAQVAREAKIKTGPSYLKYTAIGALLGTLLCMAWFIFKYLSDDTIKTKKILKVFRYDTIGSFTMLRKLKNLKATKSNRSER